jgi:2-keto-3-deoxy-L-rhamnonate aldolase RhmA
MLTILLPWRTAESTYRGESMRNVVRERIAAGQPAVGIVVRLSRSGDIARIAAATGHDFLYLDTQHSPLTTETVSHIALAALDCGVAPFVRVRGSSDPDIGRLLDCGALGIVVPNVETVEEARAVVAATKFPPTGRRSFSGAWPHYEDGSLSPLELMAAFNESVMTLCMIETVTGLENAERIASVDGLDGLYLGAADMTASAHASGKFADGFAIEPVLTKLVAIAEGHGLIMGCGGLQDANARAAAVRAGVRFLTHQTDLALVMAGAAAEVRAIRAPASEADR